MSDLENATAGAVDTVALVAFTDIRPVENEYTAVRPVAQLNAAEPQVAGLHHVLGMAAHVAGPLTVQRVPVDPATMQVQRENLTAIFLRPVVRAIDHHPAMCVATTGCIGGRGHAFLFQVGPVLVALVPVEVIGGLRHEFVQELVEVVAVHASVTRAGNSMPEVTDHGVDKKKLPVPVPIVSPRIGRAVADDVKLFCNWMVTKYAAVDRSALFNRCPGNTNMRTGENAVPPVQPTVRPPF